MDSLNFFFSVIFPYSGETQKERQRHRQREKQAPCWEPYVGLNSQTLASSSELKKKNSQFQQETLLATVKSYRKKKLLQMTSIYITKDSELYYTMFFTLSCQSNCFLPNRSHADIFHYTCKLILFLLS